MNEFIDFSINDEYDQIMQDQEVDHKMEPQELSSTLLEPNKMDMSLSSIFNMDDDF